MEAYELVDIEIQLIGNKTTLP